LAHPLTVFAGVVNEETMPGWRPPMGPACQGSGCHDNEKVDFNGVLKPHIEATRHRMGEQEVVILPQDTTEIDLTRPGQRVSGAGPLDGGPRRGVFLHLLHAFTADGAALGTVHATVLARADAPPPKKSHRAARRRRTPIEDKDSCRWIEGFCQARAEAQRAPRTEFVSVADSEADIYELLVEAEDRPANLHWIVRACQNRALAGTESQGAEAAEGDAPFATCASRS